MKRFAILAAVLARLAIFSAAYAVTVHLAWDASTTPTVTGYRLHYGQQSRTYDTQVDVGAVLTAVLEAPFVSGIPYYFVTTAYDGAGQESGYSNEVTHTFTAVPGLVGLVLAYGFSENAGTSTTDSAGTHQGTFSAGASWGAGHTGPGVAFNGTSSYVVTPHVADLSLTTTGTIEAWVWLTTLGRWHGIVAKGLGNSNAAHNYAIEVTNANIAQCVLGTGSSTLVVAELIAPVVVQTWTHVACTWNGATVRLYLDGAQVASVAQTLTPAANTAPLELGRFGGGFDTMAGTVDDVRIYNRALTLTEVQADMATPVGHAPPATAIHNILWSMP